MEDQRSRAGQILRLSLLGTGVAFAAGAAAFALYHLIGLFTNLFYYERIGWDFVDPANGPAAGTLWSVGIPVIGGLIVALMIRYGSEKISGHGIPEAMEAVLTARSRIQPRVGILKPLSAAVAIGSGGPFGAEGPIIQTGGAVGSLAGQAMRMTAAERRTLLACGAAAGMAATFGTPVAAILLVIELLLFEFRARSFIPVAVASGIGALLYGAIFGPGPLFPVPAGTSFGGLAELPVFALLGGLCGLLAVLLTKSLYGLEDLSDRIPVNKFWFPALGGVAVGVLGLFVPRILGVGYDTLQDILNEPALLIATTLLVLLVAKFLAWLVALSFGTSGGVLAPLFLMGGAFGALVGAGVLWASPGFAVSTAAFALVGMAALFGAASRATFASIVFAAEVSGAYSGAVALLVGCAVADAVMILLMGDTTIMTEKLARRGLKVRHEYEANLLDMVLVSEVMTPKPRTVPATMPAPELRDLIANIERPEYHMRSFPVVDAAGNVVAVVTRNDLFRERNRLDGKTVLDVGTKDPVVVRPDDSIYTALQKLVWKRVGHLPVVDARGRPVGYLSRGDINRAWEKKLAEEGIREGGLHIRWPRGDLAGRSNGRLRR